MSDSTRELTPEEREKFAADALKSRAEAAKFEAERRKAEAEAEMEEIERDKMVYSNRKRLADDEHFHIYRFNDSVSSASAKSCMTQLATWSRMDPNCSIEIVFCSPGGSVIDGMYLFDFIQKIRRDGHNVTTKTFGYAASMAGILLQAGDTRVMAKESWLMIHEAAFGAIGKTSEVEDTVEWVKRIQERILNIFAERSQSCDAERPLTKAQIKRRWNRKDWWISSDEALKYGLVDSVE